jgi:hypothetical protein
MSNEGTDSKGLFIMTALRGDTGGGGTMTNRLRFICRLDGLSSAANLSRIDLAFKVLAGEGKSSPTFSLLASFPEGTRDVAGGDDRVSLIDDRRSGSSGRVRGKFNNSDIFNEDTSNLRLATNEGGESSTILVYALSSHNLSQRR